MEMDQKEATKTVEELIQLYTEKVDVCKEEETKIMTTMREVEELIRQFNSLPQH